MKQRIISFVCVICICTLSMVAQNISATEQYNEFRRKAMREYDDFRNKCNQTYVEFVRRAWKEHQLLPAIPIPEEEKVPLVVRPEVPENEEQEVIPIHPDKDVKEGDTPVPMIENTPSEDEEPVIELIPTVEPEPQPLPVAPIYEESQPVEQYFTFDYCGTECKVRLGDVHRFTIDGCDVNEVADAWNFCSGSIYKNVIRDCLELRIRHSLCDWAYLQLLQALGNSFFDKGSNEATLLAAFLYCQSGYKMRLAHDNRRLYLLVASKHTIYGQRYFTVNNENYYLLSDRATSSMYICEAAFPQEQALSLWMLQSPIFDLVRTDGRTLQSKRYPNMQANVFANKNLLTFFDSYPASEIGGNCMTSWAMYAQTPLSKECVECLYPTLRRLLNGVSELEAANRLLNFVQTAFEYGYDDELWGDDRALFAEETMYYPYSDCEDRSILYSHLVRDLLGLDVALVYYPGHLATAVCFNGEVQGDYIIIDNRRFVICDPTYINALVGESMPTVNSNNMRVTVLKKNLYDEEYLVELGELVDTEDGDNIAEEGNNSNLSTDVVQSLFPVCVDGKYGYQDAEGEIIVPCEYERVSGYQRGDKFPYAAHKNGLIDLYEHLGLPLIRNIKEYIPFELNRVWRESGAFFPDDNMCLIKFEDDSLWYYVDCFYLGVGTGEYCQYPLETYDFNGVTYENNIYCEPVDGSKGAKKFVILKERDSSKYGVLMFAPGPYAQPPSIYVPFVYDSITFVKDDRSKVEAFNKSTGERKVISLMEE